MSTADLLGGGGYSAADEENDSDVKSGAPSSEEERGVDLMGDNTDQDDSSDEGEDDSEEERQIKEGEHDHQQSRAHAQLGPSPARPTHTHARAKLEVSCNSEPAANCGMTRFCQDLLLTRRKKGKAVVLKSQSPSGARRARSAQRSGGRTRTVSFTTTATMIKSDELVLT